MNKKMILPFVAILVLAVAMVGAASADEVTTVDKVEVRGAAKDISTSNANVTWDAINFAAFWFDLDDNLYSEELKLLSGAISGDADRTIDEDKLLYTTHAIPQEYELHENEGLVVESDNPAGDTGYWIEGWMAEEYIAIDNNSDKLCKLLVEFEDDDKKTLSTGEEWDLGSGFSLTANQIDLEGDKVWFSLKKDGRELDSEVASTGAGTVKQDRVYTYTADIGGEEDIPVFSCYVDAVFRGTDSNIVQVMYVFLTDDDVLEIDTSDTYGIMEVMTASKSGIILRNNEDTLDLDTDTKEHIMGNMYFKTADDNSSIRFYPMVEYTIGEGGEGDADDEDEVETPTDTNETEDGNVTPTAVVTPTAEEVASPVVTATDDDTTAPTETATEGKTPGFEAVFAIAGLLAVAYLVLRQRE